MDVTALKKYFDTFLGAAIDWASSPQFYSQVGLIVLAIILAYSAYLTLKKRSPLLRQVPAEGPAYALRNSIYQMRSLLFPLLLILVFSITARISDSLIEQSWLIRIFISLAVVFMLYSLITRLIKKQLARKLATWIVIPVAILQVFGWLDDVTTYLDSIALEVGNIKISAYGVVRVLIFGSILFWLGRVSNSAGQKIIRNQEELDLGTREVFAKLFQVLLAAVLLILLLQIMGINLTTLAVFGGALGVGLGFGLQAIASNFISGIILLLDRSLTVGDYVEMADGRCGTLRQLNMRSTTLETFDGKDIMVPNEQFITTSFTNWTHKNKTQRYSLEFQVAYKTDLNKMLKRVREVVASHPQVLSGPDVATDQLADAEIKDFGDSGINILVEFWMEGIDDGPNRVGADLLLMIWNTLNEEGIEIPFPQREVRFLNEGTDDVKGAV